MNSIRKYVAEFIGTFVLVFFACGTAAVVGCSAENGTGYLLTALAFGLVIVAMALFYWQHFGLSHKSCCFNRHAHKWQNDCC